MAYFDFASTRGERRRVGVELTARPPGERLGVGEASTRGERRRVEVELTARPPGERLGVGERRRVGVELTSRPPPGERLAWDLPGF